MSSIAAALFHHGAANPTNKLNITKRRFMITSGSETANLDSIQERLKKVVRVHHYIKIKAAGHPSGRLLQHFNFKRNWR
jgi:hypothetical protein